MLTKADELQSGVLRVPTADLRLSYYTWTIGANAGLDKNQNPSLLLSNLHFRSFYLPEAVFERSCSVDGQSSHNNLRPSRKNPPAPDYQTRFLTSPVLWADEGVKLGICGSGLGMGLLYDDGRLMCHKVLLRVLFRQWNYVMSYSMVIPRWNWLQKGNITAWKGRWCIMQSRWAIFSRSKILVNIILLSISVPLP